MQFYSQLSDDERDQIAILRAAGRSTLFAPAPPPSRRRLPSVTSLSGAKLCETPTLEKSAKYRPRTAAG